jgi:hypothetical protein
MIDLPDDEVKNALEDRHVPGDPQIKLPVLVAI